MPLVGPVAEKLGIDLTWFGVLLAVNMQTSFMHPPFGFALFYLRSVAPKTVKTSDIYKGAIPFVLIQVVMVGLIIAFPNLVSVEKKVDMKEQIELKLEMPPEEKASDEIKLEFSSDADPSKASAGKSSASSAAPSSSATSKDEGNPFGDLQFSSDSDPAKSLLSIGAA